MSPQTLPLFLFPLLVLAHPHPSPRFPTPTNPPPSLCGTYPLPYCTGTNYTLATPTQRRAHLCGDSRLGPILLPDLVLPLDSVFDIYSRFGTTNSPASSPSDSNSTTNSSLPGAGDTRLCPSSFLLRWWNTTTSRFNYPPADGFALDDDLVPIKGNVTLRVGVLLDRFGGEGGTFLSPAGAPFLQRALPPGNLGVREGDFPVFPYNYHVYRVTRPLLVRAGPIAPWFGQPGQGVQYETSENVTTLVAMDFLKRVDPKEILREEGNGEGSKREGKGNGKGKGRGRGGRGGEDEDEEIFDEDSFEGFGDEEGGEGGEGLGGFEGEEGEEGGETLEEFGEEDEEGLVGFGGEDEGEGQEEGGFTSLWNEEDAEPLDEEPGIFEEEDVELPEEEAGEIHEDEDGGALGEDEEPASDEGGLDEAPEEEGGPELDVSDEPLAAESE
ncbi:hypothetical protein B0T18DRAFT_466108 [Schizothecium vesticola]|uniref:TNT domain-containing protein n=1 Tax=Schizothecium vesticola TaxID=314040 RepID=A0AA40K610_9PEZI|nr:hypothetical protein B0T18DRAFT_466108 [Schizothecium vesticola]